MGGILIDGRAGLQFKGSFTKLMQALNGVSKIQKKLGPDTLKIETVPLPEGGIIIDLRFKGSMQQFETMLINLEDLRGSVAIETVPLPEQIQPGLDSPKIGTWPTPEKPKSAWRWIITATMA